METVLYDAARAEAFAGRLTETFNDASLALMISVGHRTGLFDAFAGIGSVTSEELAAVAGLDERYVREWLGAMVTGAVVDYDAQAGTYRLPPEHAEWLTRAASPNNLAVTSQYFSVLGSVEDDIVRVFREGGGVPYERFGRFHEVMEEDSGQTVVAGLFEHILPLVPGMQERLEQGSSLVDLGCGRGRALIALAQRFPQSRFLGLDLSPAAIASAREQARDLDNVEFEVRDLSTFDRDAEPQPGSFEFATTFDAVHDQARPLALLLGIRRVLAPGGIYLMQDIHGSSHVERNLDHELGTLLYTISCLHCMTVSLAQGGEGLGAMWGEEKARELLAEAGFGSVELHRLDHDPVNAYYVVRP